MIMQDPMTSLNPLKTIGDQILEAVTLHQGLKGTEARARTLEYLRDVGISDVYKRQRVPFGDLDFVRYVMAIDPEMKLNRYNKGKYLLRKAFEGCLLYTSRCV